MTRTLGGKDLWLTALAADAADFREAVREAELSSPVPSCPEWTIGDLINHLGRIYGFVSAHLVRDVTTPPAGSSADYTAPAGTDLRVWWDERLAELTRVLTEVDPDRPAWNWAPRSKTAGFWHRRMAHETAIHRWDAQFALVAAEPVEGRLALDGIAEVLDTWLPAGRGTGPTGTVGVVALHATEPPHNWYLRLREGGLALLDTDTVFDSAPHHERAMARGTASDLLLALYGRIGFDVLELAGDERLLASLRVG